MIQHTRVAAVAATLCVLVQVVSVMDLMHNMRKGRVKYYRLTICYCEALPYYCLVICNITSISKAQPAY